MQHPPTNNTMYPLSLVHSTGEGLVSFIGDNISYEYGILSTNGWPTRNLEQMCRIVFEVHHISASETMVQSTFVHRILV